MADPVVGFGGNPLRLDADEVATVMTIQGQSIPWRNAPNPHRSFQEGDLAKITGGKHAGRTVPVVEIEGQFAVFIENHFGRDRKRRVPLSFLEAA